MSIKSNLMKAGALGLVATALTAGAALAATATSTVNVRSGPSTGYGVIDQSSRRATTSPSPASPTAGAKSRSPARMAG